MSDKDIERAILQRLPTMADPKEIADLLMDAVHDRHSRPTIAPRIIKAAYKRLKQVDGDAAEGFRMFIDERGIDVDLGGAAIMEECGKCDEVKKKSDWTCPHCGHTEWGIIVSLGIFGLAWIGAGAAGYVLIGGAVLRNLVGFGLGIVGCLILIGVITEVVEGLKQSKK